MDFEGANKALFSPKMARNKWEDEAGDGRENGKQTNRWERRGSQEGNDGVPPPGMAGISEGRRRRERRVGPCGLGCGPVDGVISVGLPHLADVGASHDPIWFNGEDRRIWPNVRDWIWVLSSTLEIEAWYNLRLNVPTS
jgi:hypothetical protein